MFPTGRDRMKDRLYVLSVWRSRMKPAPRLRHRLHTVFGETHVIMQNLPNILYWTAWGQIHHRTILQRAWPMMHLHLRSLDRPLGPSFRSVLYLFLFLSLLRLTSFLSQNKNQNGVLSSFILLWWFGRGWSWRRSHISYLVPMSDRPWQPHV